MAKEASAAKDITIKLSYDLETKNFVYDKKHNFYSMYEYYLRYHKKYKDNIILSAIEILLDIFNEYDKALLHLYGENKGMELKNCNDSNLSRMQVEKKPLTTERMLNLLSQV